MAAGLNGGLPEQERGPGWNRVSDEQYSQIWRSAAWVRVRFRREAHEARAR
jgi:hypothetical protein